jgi:hypothetical protein
MQLDDSAFVIQRDDQWLKTASPEEILHAKEQGELAEVMGQRVPVARHRPIGEQHLKQMSPAEIARAYEDGDLDELLGRSA